ncbi:unnamed protein product [Gadus morhua 'NCC']
MDGDSAGSERRASPSLRLAAPRPVLAAAHLQLLASRVDVGVSEGECLWACQRVDVGVSEGECLWACQRVDVGVSEGECLWACQRVDVGVSEGECLWACQRVDVGVSEASARPSSHCCLHRRESIEQLSWFLWERVVVEEVEERVVVEEVEEVAVVVVVVEVSRREEAGTRAIIEETRNATGAFSLPSCSQSPPCPRSCEGGGPTRRPGNTWRQNLTETKRIGAGA